MIGFFNSLQEFEGEDCFRREQDTSHEQLLPSDTLDRAILRAGDRHAV